MLYDINILAVILSAVSVMVLGFLWYSPLLFAKPWMKLMGIEPGSMDTSNTEMFKTYSFSMVANIVFAIVLAIFIRNLYIFDVGDGVLIGFLAWIGFSMPTTINYALYENRQWTLYAVNTGYNLVSFLIAGAIIAYFH